MKIHNIDQGTPERFAVRQLKMTASHAQAIGSNGKGLETYIKEMMSEHYSSAEKEHHSNAHTDRGHELEPLARGMYELETGNQVTEVGFIEYDEHVGCSPDGLVNNEGLLEIKCQSDKVHFELILNGKIDTGYVRQMQMQMYVSGRQWCDFVAYNPNYKQSLRIKRVHIDPDAQDKLAKGFVSGKSQILEIINKLGH